MSEPGTIVMLRGIIVHRASYAPAMLVRRGRLGDSGLGYFFGGAGRIVPPGGRAFLVISE